MSAPKTHIMLLAGIVVLLAVAGWAVIDPKAAAAGWLVGFLVVVPGERGSAAARASPAGPG